MNIETKLDERLWAAVQEAWEGRNYSAAILDGIHFLGNLLRDRTGLEEDGVSLVGKALGGKSPRLRVNKLQSESDWNVQQGLEQLLRGVYQAIRNPRSHEKYKDSLDDAAAILLFLNHLIRIVDQSRVQFSEPEFLHRVMDPDFVESSRYAKLLVDEIPKKKVLDVFFSVYRKKTEGKWNKLKYFFPALIERLGKDEKKDVYHAISEELKTTDDTSVIYLVLQCFPKDIWLQIDEAARLRIENKLIHSIAEGSYVSLTKRCRAGALGTWATSIFEHFEMKNEALCTIARKLDSDDQTELEYATKFFLSSLDVLAKTPPTYIVSSIKNKLREGNKAVYDALSPDFSSLSEEWTKPFKKELEEFEEAEPTFTIDDDDIPF